MIREILQSVYDNTIRNYLPRKIKLYNGVALNTGRLLDTNVIDPDYKQGTIDPLRELTRHDDDITVIGGGFGVSAVVAARQGQSVTVIEGGEDFAKIVRETAELNRVDQNITVTEAIIGKNIDVYGESMADTKISPGELAPCDVLEMDCEGVEEDILRGMEITPRVVIVESHPQFDVDPRTIQVLLENQNYVVQSTFELDGGNVTMAATKID